MAEGARMFLEGRRLRRSILTQEQGLRCDSMRIYVWLVSGLAIAVVSNAGCTSASSDPTPVMSSGPVVPASTTIGGVALVTPTSEVERYCQAAADRLDWAILCPSLLPVDPYFPDTCCLARSIFLIQEVFKGPPSYVGMPDTDGSASDVGHLNIWSIPSGTLDTAGVGCTANGSPGGTIDMNGAAARLIACPAGRNPPQDSGHIVLQWSEAGIVYAVSVHTDTPVNRRLALFVAEHLVIVEPQGG